ncbi:MAG: hypothetical protein OCC45_15600 [Desulfotalea sp.]
MKKIIVALMLSFSLLLVNNVVAMDIQEGMSTYSWGEKVAKYPELSKVGEKGAISYYSKAGETYTVGKVVVDHVVYGFSEDNMLFGVFLNIDSFDSYDDLVAHMKSKYGLPGYKTDKDNVLVMKWKKENITVKLKLNKENDKMKLAFYYRPISTKLNPTNYEDVDTSSFKFLPMEENRKAKGFVLFKF